MNVLVTGADGLLGSHLVRLLLQRGDSVRVLVQPGSTSPTLAGLPLDRRSGDLLAADEPLCRALRGCGTVFHCAAVTDLRADPEIVWKVNYQGTLRLLKACVAEQVRRFVYTGSASSFGFGAITAPGTEEHPFPQAYRGLPYMESKCQAMNRVKARAQAGDLETVTVAPTFLLGADDWRPSSGELIRQYILRGLRFVSPGGRNFVYAPDVARLLAAAAERGRNGECYLAAGHNLTYFDFFSRVAAIHGGVHPPRRVLPPSLVLAAGWAGAAFSRVSGKPAVLDTTLARLSLYGTYYSAEKAVRELGLEQTPIDTAIREAINSLRKFGHIPG